MKTVGLTFKKKPSAANKPDSKSGDKKANKPDSKSGDKTKE